MHGLSFKSKFTISLVLSLILLLSGVAVLAQEDTQTPSEKVGEGAREVIEGVLAEYEEFDESTLSRAESLIDEGLPPGTMVAVVKSLETGHLSPEELDSVFTDLEENVVNGDKPVGLVIKSIKTTYQLPEEVEAEEEGKPDEAGPPEDKEEVEDTDDEEGAKSQGKSNKADQSEEKGQKGEKGNGDEKGQPGDKGTSEEEDKGNEGKSDEAGPPEDEGENAENEDEENNGPPKDEGNSGEAGPPENEEEEEE